VLNLATQMKRFEIAPEIEIFDLSHIHGAKRLIDVGQMSPGPHVQFVMGVQNAPPADERLLDIPLVETRRTIPGATWTAAGIGRHQSLVMQWALERGADAVRAGMEDNIRIAKDRLVSGNDELVHIAVGLLERFDCRPATPAEAPSSLSLRSA
jgi:3-keto-5-aminohexanoate cleavage enzyme